MSGIHQGVDKAKVGWISRRIAEVRPVKMHRFAKSEPSRVGINVHVDDLIIEHPDPSAAEF
jgi:hypothetical protein